jgi:hypothetical protein
MTGCGVLMAVTSLYFWVSLAGFLGFFAFIAFWGIAMNAIMMIPL